jgi:hypothetical protein
MKRNAICSLTVLVLLASPSIALAHGDAVITLASTVAGGGALTTDYEFDSVSKVDFSASIAGVSIYTGIFPGFEPLAADAPPLYALDNGTEVSVQITAVDAGKTAMKIDTTVLNAVGDTAVLGTVPFDHTHPELQLLLELPEGEFGEGRISFKLIATAGPSYAESPVYTLKISNGPLAPADFDTAEYDKATVKCFSKVRKTITKFVATEQNLLGKCLDKVQAFAAKAALDTPPPSLAAAQATAEKACADASGSGPDSKTMLGRLEAAKAKAIAAVQAACGASGSGTLSDDDITQQIGLASCRAEELIAATYGLAHSELEEINVRPSQGGDTVTDHLPCLFLTASD